MSPSSELDQLHHVAISVDNIATAVDWYRQQFRCEVTYQDETWAMLRFGNVDLALVIPDQHPPHLGFAVANAQRHGKLKTHRDGTRSIYISDPAGNAVEMVDRESIAAADSVQTDA